MHALYTFLILFAFWIVLSGKFDAFHLTLGLISCALVTFLSSDLLFHDKKKKGRLAETGRFIFFYIPWLLIQIILSTIHVSILALHPRMKARIDPRIVRFRTRLEKGISRVVFANSITLTPGTITIRDEEGEFYVHAIDEKSAQGVPGEMENNVAKVFEREQ